jgi:hypothetical protein
MFLVAVLQSQQSALLPLLLSQAKLKQFLSIAEIRRRDRRIPRCTLIVFLPIQETGRLLNYVTEGLLVEDPTH